MNKPPLWKHLIAFCYDMFPIFGVFLLTSLIVLLIRNGVEVKPQTLWFALLLLSEMAFYFIYSWKIGGQTLGMRAWKMKIVPNNSQLNTLTWKQATLRLLIGTLSTLLLGLGLFWKFISKRDFTWMDMVSDSHMTSIE